MRKNEIVLNTKVTLSNSTIFAKYIGTIVSEEVSQVEGSGKCQVLVQFDEESTPRYVAGSRLVKIDF